MKQNFSYAEYLKTEHWMGLREAKLRQANCTCAGCGHVSASNDVHHLNYEGGVYSVTLGDLRVLCRRCHGLAHKFLEEFPWAKKLPSDDHATRLVRYIVEQLAPERKEKRRVRRALWKQQRKNHTARKRHDAGIMRSPGQGI